MMCCGKFLQITESLNPPYTKWLHCEECGFCMRDVDESS